MADPGDLRELERADPGVFHAPASIGFSARVGVDGATAWRGDDRIGLKLRSYGRTGALAPVLEAQPQLGGCAVETSSVPCVRRVETRRGPVTEWWVGRTGGLQQGWTLYEPPEGEGTVELVVEVTSGAVSAVWRRGAQLVGSTGKLWSYDGLMAWDADGRPVEAVMSESHGWLAIRLDISSARWPINVDPTLSQSKITAPAGSTRDYFGIAVAGPGDIDGDGYDDFVVGAPNDDEGATNTGAAFVFFGSGSGMGSGRRLLLAERAEFDNFGNAVAGPGDVNGDGYADVVIGEIGDHEIGGPTTGAARVFHGTPEGLQNDVKLAALDNAADVLFGHALTGADVNGDGYADVVVSAIGDGDDAGAIYAYVGSATGVNRVSEVKITASNGQPGDLFGSAVSGAGDLDGDGYDDLIVGAPGAAGSGLESGAAYVYFGTAIGLDAGSEVQLIPDDATAGDQFGLSVGGGGDLNGDMFADLIVGAASANAPSANSGSVYAFYGAADGLGDGQKVVPSDSASYDYFGAAVAMVGDVDRDGFDDVVVGAPSDDGATVDTGSVYLFYGSSTGLAARPEDKLIALFGGRDDQFGTAIAGTGDVNGDGRDGFVIGAWGVDDQGNDSGAVYVSYGICDDADEDGVCEEDDCDDDDAQTYPGAAQSDSTTACMTDADGDGWGDQAPATGVVAGTDCDDDSRAVHPGAAPHDSPDACMKDGDGDGYGDADPPIGADTGTDCDDGDRTINPGADEVVGDEVDQDCDGMERCYVDADGDGYMPNRDPIDSDDAACDTGPEARLGLPSGDCDDADPAIHPGAEEVARDGIDQDCDGEDEVSGGEGGCACGNTGAPVPLAIVFGLLIAVMRRRGGGGLGGAHPGDCHMQTQFVV